MKSVKRLAALPLVFTLVLSMMAVGCAAERQPQFEDIPAGAWYAEAVEYCRENGLMSGTAANRFEPDGAMTRAMVATVLYRGSGESAVTGNPAFIDVEPNVWYSNVIAWANANGIVQGYGNGLFGTNDPITREQLDVIIRRYKGETSAWTGDPALAVPAARSEAAMAFYTNLREEEAPAGTGKVLVAYFSATGSTGRVAQTIVSTLDVDLFEITPVDGYTSADLSWTTPGSRVNREHDDERQRDIELVATTPENWDSYDVVFLGYPIWWQNASWVVNSFVKDNDFSGKTVVSQNHNYVR